MRTVINFGVAICDFQSVSPPLITLTSTGDPGGESDALPPLQVVSQNFQTFCGFLKTQLATKPGLFLFQLMFITY